MTKLKAFKGLSKEQLNQLFTDGFVETSKGVVELEEGCFYFYENETVDPLNANLIAEIVATGGEASIFFDGLDITADGGVYDVIISGYATSDVTNLQLKFGNNNLSSNYGTSGQGGIKYDIADGAPTIGGWSSRNSAMAEIGGFYGKIGFIQLTLSKSKSAYGNTISFLAKAFSESTKYLNQGTQGGFSATPMENLTQIELSLASGGFAEGTSVRIYKRATNVATREQGVNL